MSLGIQIKKYRQKFGITLEQLEETSGVPWSTIGALESRKSTSSKYAMDIARGLGLTLEQLLDESREYERDETISKPESVVKLDPIPLYRRPLWNKMDEKGEPIMYINPIGEHGKKAYAVKVRDDTLFDLEDKIIIRKGDIVALDPDMIPKNKDIVFATSSKYELASLKVFRIQDGKKYLYTPNPDWQEKWLPIDETIEIHAVAFEVVKLIR